MKFRAKHRAEYARKLWILLLLAAALCLGGCWDKKELNQLALAQVIAIDYSDNQYQVTLQLMIPSAENDTITSDNLWPATGTGASVGEAMQQIALEAPREIYLDHLDLVLLGEGILQHSVAQGLEYLLHENVLRRRTRLLAVEGNAGELLSASGELAKMDIFYMDNLLKDQRRRVHGSDATINAYYLCNDNGPIETLVIPRLKMEAEKSLSLTGAALVHNDTLTQWVDRTWLYGYYWAVGGSDVMTLQYDAKNDHGKMQQVIVELQMKPCKWEIVSEKPLEVKAVMHGTIKIVSGYDSWKNSVEADAICRRIQQQVEEKSLQQIQYTFYMAQAQGTDAFHLGRWLYGWHPQLIEVDSWPEQFQSLPITVTMQTKVKL